MIREFKYFIRSNYYDKTIIEKFNILLKLNY
jgi:hypothetical protein